MQCPHCLQHFHEAWTWKALDQDSNGLWWAAGHTKCAACQRVIISLEQATIYMGTRGELHVTPPVRIRYAHPRATARNPVPAEVPADFADDYVQACLVLPESEKASAALSRRCLQNLLREKLRVKKDDLAKEIQQVLDSNQLPSHLAENLDAVRNIGNFAAHPLKATASGEIVNVEPHEAEWSLTVLESLFDFCFVRPARDRARRADLDAKLKASGKPPMKGP